jgi:hypothetical protein
MVRIRGARLAVIAALTTLAAAGLGVPSALARGILPGTFSYKLHAPVPLLSISGGFPFSQRAADVKGLFAAPFVTQAGAHPDASSTSVLDFSDGFEIPRDIVVDAPAGFVGNPTAVAVCDREAFHNTWAPDGDRTKGCSPSTQVGVITSLFGGFLPSQTFPVYRLTPAPGHSASFGFPYSFASGLLLNADLRTDGDYGLTLSSTAIGLFSLLPASFLTFWGVPADPVHDPERWDQQIGDWGASVGIPQVPLIANPTDCNSGILGARLRMRYWTDPGHWLPEDPEDPTYRAFSPEPRGCEKLSFAPRITLLPSISNSDSPTGVSVQMEIPQNHDPDGLATPPLRKAVFTLPEGMSINPAAADGLRGCTSAEIGLLGTDFPYPNPIHFAKGDSHCPQASKIGAGVVETDLLEEQLQGDVYLASPYDNPFHSLLALYLVFRGPGFVVKLPGKVEADPRTGRLTTTFDPIPQLPFENLTLNFFGGPRAPLATPPTCGSKPIASELTPWSAPQSGPPATPVNRYTSERGPADTPCSFSLASRPFSPDLLAGTQNPIAGAASAFSLRLGRPDGHQELAGLSITPPPGITAQLKDIPYCPEGAIERARARVEPGDGQLEREHPSCPPASRVGTLLTGAGAGPTPYFIRGSAYLAGPYKGAPLSLVTITPALAGGEAGDPVFDLGVVVVRIALYTDPQTAQITAVSDPIPQTLKGIPLRIKDVRVLLDRAGFTQNPTSCEEMPVTGGATGQNGAGASLSNRFQVADCAALGFRPRLSLRLFGATGRGRHPKLRAVLKARPGDANLARVGVVLPRSEFLDQGHIRSVCSRAQFAQGSCPQSSVYGHARAFSPLLGEPLAGPVYLRSSDHKLPDLAIALRGQVPIDVDGRIDSTGGRIRATFASLPDAPLSKFILTMQGGKKGLLVNSRDLCAQPPHLRSKLAGHNGRYHDSRPPLRSSCRTHPRAHRRPGRNRQKR